MECWGAEPGSLQTKPYGAESVRTKPMGVTTSWLEPWYSILPAAPDVLQPSVTLLSNLGTTGCVQTDQ